MSRPSTTRSVASPVSVPAPVVEGVWEDLAAVLDHLSELAAAPLKAAPLKEGQSEDDVFHRELLRITVAAIAAEGGAIWTAGRDGRLRRRSLIEYETLAEDPSQRAAHEALLQQALNERATQVRAPHSQDDQSPGSNPTAAVLIATPVVCDPQTAPTAVIEIALHAGANPTVYDAAARFLEAVCDIAGRRSLRQELARLRADQQEHQRLADLSHRVQGDLDLGRTCLRIVNETRDAVGCDRVSLVVMDERQGRLMAVSGADRVDRRTATARGMEELAEIVSRLGEPIYWADGNSDAPDDGPHTAALEQFADRSHARQVAALPLLAPEDRVDSGEPHAAHVVGVLVAEQFDASGSDLAKDRLAAAAMLCAPALASASELDNLPLLGLSRAMRVALLPKSLRRTVLAVALTGMAALGLTFIKTDFYVESPGELQPVSQQQVFAPRDGLVEGIHVTHGQRVEAGALLLSLRDPELDLAIKEVDGELATARRRLAAVRATRTSRDARKASPAEAYRLSAEQQLIEQTIDSLTTRQKLLREEQRSLTLESPRSGAVVSWQTEQTLVGRPVQRGEALLTIADTKGDWQIELQTPDDRIGHVLAARQAAGDEPLRVEYRLASEERGFAHGTIREIAQRAEPASDPAADDRHHVRVVVTPDNPQTPAADPLGLRPGLSVRARIDCGRCSLGYVWLHDLWHTLKTWWEF